MKLVPIGSCRSILTDESNAKRVVADVVPKLLTDDQMEHRAEACLELKNRISNNLNFINCIITGYEKWVFGYDRQN